MCKNFTKEYERILRNEAGIKVYHSSENKLFRALCTHKDNVNESQKPGVYRIPCECGLVYIGFGTQSSFFAISHL